MKKEISFFPEVIYSNTVFHLKTHQKVISISENVFKSVKVMWTRWVLQLIGKTMLNVIA